MYISITSHKVIWSIEALDSFWLESTFQNLSSVQSDWFIASVIHELSIGIVFKTLTRVIMLYPLMEKRKVDEPSVSVWGHPNSQGKTWKTLDFSYFSQELQNFYLKYV